MNLRKPLFVLVLIVALLGMVAVVGATKVGPRLEVQILAVNDFHGNLKPPSGSSGRITLSDNTTVDAGGVEYLSTWIKDLADDNPDTVVVSAGDTIGASPLLSALFHDEPSIEAFNEMGVEFNAVGNHEFDEGPAELKRMQQGGCHPVDGCADGDPFAGADFQYLSANVFLEGTNKTLFPAYGIKTFKYGVKVGFIGLTLEGTPNIVTPSGVAGLEFRDEADSINRLVRQLKNRGVETIVVLIHEGGFPSVGNQYDGCPGISGPILDIVNRTNDEVDIFITGHTHQAYNCVIDGRLVTSASSFGRLVTKIDVQISRQSKEVQQVQAENVIVTRTVDKDPFMTALIAKYDAIAAPLANRIIGQITATITRAANAAGESALGDVIADAQLDATNDPGFGDAVIAFMNPGGIRADLTFASSPASEGDGVVTYQEAFTVQPFGNSLVTRTLTGQQIYDLLEQQWGSAQPFARILQVSTGFTYRHIYDVNKPLGGRYVCDGSIKLNGTPIDKAAGYRVTMNSFLADGGDNFSIFTRGGDSLGGAQDLDALQAYFSKRSVVKPGPRDRIVQVDGCAP